jgi:hypothetical protein
MSDSFRGDGEGACRACDARFAYMMIHNGFNDSAFAYCDSFGGTVLLDLWTAPPGVGLSYGPIPKEAESRLARCPCGRQLERPAREEESMRHTRINAGR